MITIKRYTNRKLYNTDSRQYITLDDIAAILNDGCDIRVVDHRTGMDLTTLTLLQVILEQERQIGGLLPSVLVFSSDENITLPSRSRKLRVPVPVTSLTSPA